MLKNSFKDCRGCKDHQKMLNSWDELVENKEFTHEQLQKIIEYKDWLKTQCCLLPPNFQSFLEEVKRINNGQL